ncbi:MAG: energy-coupled thiamine transporter ThiT [Clostridia bacterium]|nr:energy-coupled thiamine transporter ThiT [Clostridia bacterium]
MLQALLSDKAKWFLFSFSTPEEIFRAAATWLAIAAVIAFVVCLFVLKGEKRHKLIRVGTVAGVIYACAVGVASLAFWLSDAGKNGEFLAILFVPLAVLVVCVAAWLVALAAAKSRAIKIVFGVCTGCAAVAALVCMGVHFASGDAAEMNWITNDDVEIIPLCISAVVAIGGVILAAFLCDKGGKPFDTRSISYAAVCIAMSFALSYLRIVKMPQGGSITIASLLPVMVYSCMFGARKGIFVGMIYGLLQAVQDPYIIHPAQFLLDYPVAFACVGLAGVFCKLHSLDRLPQLQFALGAVVAGVARFIMHYISGVFAFGSFAGEQNPYVYSLVYQAGYVLPDIAIVIVVGIFVFSSSAFVKMVRRQGVSTAA